MTKTEAAERIVAECKSHLKCEGCVFFNVVGFTYCCLIAELFDGEMPEDWEG